MKGSGSSKDVEGEYKQDVKKQQDIPASAAPLAVPKSSPLSLTDR